MNKKPQYVTRELGLPTFGHESAPGNKCPMCCTEEERNTWLQLGIQFDPELFEAWLELFRRDPMKPLILFRRSAGWSWFITSPDCRALGIRYHLKTGVLDCPCGRAPSLAVAMRYARSLATRFTGDDL